MPKTDKPSLGLWPVTGGVQDATQTSDADTDHEQDAEHLVDVDAQIGNHGTVTDDSAGQHAKLGLIDHEPESKRNSGGNSDLEQVVDGEADAEHLDAALQELGQRQQADAVAPDHNHHVADHVGNAVGQQHNIQHVFTKQWTGSFLNKVTNTSHNERYDEKCGYKAKLCGDGISKVGTQNVERALAEVDHVHAADDQGYTSHHEVGHHAVADTSDQRLEKE